MMKLGICLNPTEVWSRPFPRTAESECGEDATRRDAECEVATAVRSLWKRSIRVLDGWTRNSAGGRSPNRERTLDVLSFFMSVSLRFLICVSPCFLG